nr:uncharacterized protein LOC101886679 [Danio rerio]|eukprot:XP_009294355.1 uncharacterized protein LOC101886679 [Danio rerio]
MFWTFVFIAVFPETWRKMFYALVLFCFCFERRSGVFGAKTNEIKLVLEGDTVTLPAEVHGDELLIWRFGPDGTMIAKFSKKNGEYVIMPVERFSSRLMPEYETGSLIIRNIRTEHAGLYQLQTISSTVSTKTFTVSVYARPPIPVITRDYSLCSSSTSSPSPSAPFQCSLVCSVVNVSAVSLSWYKGNSVLSKISVSDLSSSVSLPLELEYQDKNTYSCVVNNPVSNQTTHLDIDILCQPCPAPLPIPVINTTDSPQCPSSASLQQCSLVCSVVSVSAVSLSWYKGNSLMSSISASDLSISLSLPLEVEYQDKNTYSCVVNNTIMNLTRHLDMDTLCQSCSDRVHCCGFTETVIRLVASAVVGVAVIAVLVYDVRSSRSYQKRRLQTASGQADDYDDVATAH